MGLKTKKALITGITGQDGSYLAELLLEKGYEVHGLVRNEDGSESLWRIKSILDKIVLSKGNVGEYEVIGKVIAEIQPDEVYHLATKHDLKNSLKNYRDIQATNVDSTYYLLNAIKEFQPDCKFFFASSSKVFGEPPVSPQSEEVPIRPNSLYGISKAAASALVRMYREKERVFACSGILYNHESPRRDPEFLPRKIALAVARIKSGLADELKVGDLDARRDWGFAGDYVEAMWLMLQQNQPEDFVLGSGETHSVQEMIETAFEVVKLDWRQYVKVDPAFVRSPEKFEMRADISKAKIKLGWAPKMEFKELVRIMVEAEMNRIR